MWSFPRASEQVLRFAMFDYTEAYLFNMSHVKALNSDILHQNNDWQRKVHINKQTHRILQLYSPLWNEMKDFCSKWQQSDPKAAETRDIRSECIAPPEQWKCYDGGILKITTVLTRVL